MTILNLVWVIWIRCEWFKFGVHFWATVLSGPFMHANEMTDVRVKGFKALVPGYASNILRNKSALVIGICTTFTYFQTLRLRKRGFLHETGFSLRHRYHFDGGGFLQNRKSLDFDYLKSRQMRWYTSEVFQTNLAQGTGWSVRDRN